MIDEWGQLASSRVLHAPTAKDDKYSRGVVGMRTGSLSYPGAAVLGVEGAWRSGAGLVRFVGDPMLAALILQRRPETVVGTGRVGVWVIGSGTNPAERTPEETAHLRELLAQREVPVVVDAGALDLVGGHAAQIVMTPHAGEFAALQQRLGLSATDDRAADVQAMADALGAVVLLKGSTTLVAEPGGTITTIRVRAPWLATAGTGDVLAGVIGTVIAQNAEVPLQSAASTAAWLHGRAAELASRTGSQEKRPGRAGRPILALDVAEHLPEAVATVLEFHD